MINNTARNWEFHHKLKIDHYLSIEYYVDTMSNEVFLIDCECNIYDNEIYRQHLLRAENSEGNVYYNETFEQQLLRKEYIIFRDKIRNEKT